MSDLNLGLHQPARLRKAPALRTLSSAVDYLIDSRMFLIDQPASRADSEAIQILMRLSRKVFEEEPAKAINTGQGLQLWISKSLAAN
jgi:hypothetical protein